MKHVVAPRRIVITGVSKGLGRAMADAFIRDGHQVLGCARNAAAIAALRETHGTRHHFAVLDVRDDAAVKAWASELLQAFGPPGLLINNAAVVNRPAPLWETPAAAFDALIDTNLKGVANVLRHFVPAMVAAGSGVIVNFSSGWGRSAAAEMAPYCASKWAIEGLTQALAQELPKGMAAAPLDPGIIDTDMLRQAFGSAAAGYPSPDDWAARAVPFLLKLGARDNGRQLSVP